MGVSPEPDGRRAIVVEANEVPLRVITDVAETGRTPFLADLLSQDRLFESTATDEPSRGLYPSQSWASLNTGVAYDRHRIYWYGDPKPEDVPFHWQKAAAAGCSVGLVNSLHSSPVATQCVGSNFRFVIPDSFSAEHTTIPDTYERFQAANTSLTGANGRTVGAGFSPADVARVVASIPRLGLRARTAGQIARLVAGVASGRTPKERLRCGQFLLQQDLFLTLFDRHTPDLAVFFTNHVAAAMHRYWYAMYPGDFSERHYSDEWVDRHRDEIPHALVLLDRLMSALHERCRADDRTLVLASSMGQGPSTVLRAEVEAEATVVDHRKFLDALDIGSDVGVRGAMAPQLTLDCGDPARAAAVAAELSDSGVGEVFWDVDGSEGVVTLTCQIEVVDGSTVSLRGRRRSARSVGVRIHRVADHSSGRHIPEGVIGVANSPSFKPPIDGTCDYLEYAPALLIHLGIQPLDHHVSPSYAI